jgi:flagellar motor switch protein FliN/FliY
MTTESQIPAPESVSAIHPSAALKDADSDPPPFISPARGGDKRGVVAHVADFAEQSAAPPSGAPAPLDRLLDVTVTVTAELGRVTLPISAILNLNVHSVLELNRGIAEPVDLMVQGVLLARGEVVVVDDRFAVRIKEVAEPKKRI